ncbi:MAG: hypothetical protein HY264_02790 [Chloroflexi bacterium]|nr:hypothetical protein [Chloroflexota bacterium]
MTRPLVIGSASRDVTPDDPRGWRLGGAVAFCGLTLARLGLRPRVLLGVDATASAADELDLLRRAGADVHVVRLPAGPVFRNRSTPGGRVQDCLEPGAPIDPVVPAGWAEAATWLLVPVADEVTDAWAGLPPVDAFVAVGWQGLLRNLPRGGTVSRRPPTRSAVIERADLVSLSSEDVAPGTLPATLTALLGPRATLVLTNGSDGGSIWSADADGRREARRYPATPTAGVVDPTGAGDTFLAALVAARLGHPLAAPGGLDAALRLAAAVASLSVEGPGLLGVPTLAAVAARLGRVPDRDQGDQGDQGTATAPPAGPAGSGGRAD